MNSDPVISADFGAVLVWLVVLALVVVIAMTSIKGFKKSVAGGASAVEARRSAYRHVYTAAALGFVACAVIWIFRTEIFYGWLKLGDG